jgi:uncharacterized protein
MPAALTYPGVYVEEIPSGIRPISGVATSITAFVGRARRGPTDADRVAPVVVNSFGDFERIFGGLWLDSALSFAVRDFFLNGGAQALIVRLYKSSATPKDKASITHSTLTVTAANPGSWGNQLRIRIDHAVRPLEAGEVANDLFNLTVRDGGTGTIEVHRNVTWRSGRRNSLDKVLENTSSLIRAALPVSQPTAHDAGTGKDIWADNTPATSAKVETTGQADDGQVLTSAEFSEGTGLEDAKRGIYALKKADLFNLLCIPPYKADGSVDTAVTGKAGKLCEDERAFLIVDPPPGWSSKAAAVAGAGDFSANLGTASKNAAVYFPRLRMPNPLRDGQEEDFAICGAIAGIMARTDGERGIWKAPAGLEARLVGVPAVSVSLTDSENGELNPLGVNCLRTMPSAGRVVWGSRTLMGSDRLGSEWKYVPIRRLALFLEESLYRGTQWAVFEPNDAPLWAQLRLNIGAFMQGLFRQGAFAGATPREAYFVKCDASTTTASDQNLGIVNIIVGFAPLKPAEFVVLKFQQMAGQIAT